MSGRKPLTRRAVIPALLALVALAAAAGVALAAPADLDPSFGQGGGVTIDSGGAEVARALAVQPDGKIVLAGSTTANGDAIVDRVNPDGSLDGGFDSDGRRPIDGGGVEEADAVALQPDGKILVAGSTSINDDAVVYRLNPDGSFDPSFAGVPVRIDSGHEDAASALAVQPDGKILVAGRISIPADANSDAAVYRLNADGSLDTTFDGDGKLTIDTGHNDSAYALAVRPDGRILVAGYSSNPVDESADTAVYRLSPDGSFDTSFDGDGKLALDSGPDDIGYALAVQPDGKILVAGVTSAPGDAVVHRLSPDGSLDPSFDGDGTLVIASGASESARALALQPDGKILVAGGSSATKDAIVYRIDPDGSLDPGFGNDGKLDITSATSEFADALAIQSDGKILVAGAGGASADALVYRLEGGSPPSVSTPPPPPAATPPPATPPATNPPTTGATAGSQPARKARCAGRRATIVGTRGRDRIRGTRRRDVIAALGGNDVIRGLSGNDVICGGAGKDRIFGGAGKDRILGGAGGDRISGGTGRDTLRGQSGRDRLAGGPGRDRLLGGPGRDVQKQ